MANAAATIRNPRRVRASHNAFRGIDDFTRAPGVLYQRRSLSIYSTSIALGAFALAWRIFVAQASFATTYEETDYDQIH
jgi:hypothetical protein